MNNQRFYPRRHYGRTLLTLGCSVLTALAISVVPGALFGNQEFNPKTEPSNPVAIEMQIDKREAQIAESIQVKITATAPQGVTVKFPELQKQLGGFEVTGVQDAMDIPAGSNRNWIRIVNLESLVSGELEIPVIQISYIDGRGSSPRTGFCTTTEQRINIRSTLEGVEDPKQFRDIKSVMFAPETPPRSNVWLVTLAAAASFALVAALVYVANGRRKNLSPKDWAIKSIGELRDSQAFNDNDAEQVYVRLVSILRTFVDWHFGISAPKLTTDEFLSAMQQDERLSAEFRSELSELLTLADMIKFAGLSPDDSQLAAVVDQAKRMVENAKDSEMKIPESRNGSNDSSANSHQLQPIAEDN